MSRLLIFTIFLIILHCQLLLQPATGALNLSSLLEGPDFRIDVRVGFQRKDSIKIVEESQLTEFYSPRRQRARLVFRPITYIHKIQYFCDINQNLLLKHAPDPYVLTCKLSEPSSMTRDIFGMVLGEQKLLSASVWLVQRPQVPNYVIGAFRLLAVINNQKDKLVFDSISVEAVRNHEVIKYKLDDIFSNSTLYVYYAKTDNLWTEVDVPLRVEMVLDDDLKLVVDFSLLKLVDQIDFQESRSQDALSYPIGHACSAILKHENLFFDLEQPKVFSFRAEFTEQRQDKHKISYFIAYDGFMNAMRTDQVQDFVSINSESIRSRTYLDFISNRKYNVKDSDSDCVGARIVVNEDELEPKSYLKKILPFDSLASLGFIEVRGIRTEVFEHLTEVPPVHLFPRILLNDSDGHLQSIFRPEPNILANGSSIRREFTVVYYFSSETIEKQSQLQLKGNSLGPLMRIEIYEKKLLSYTIEVFEFVWELAQAPDGDRPHQLFVLPETCVNSNRNRYGRMLLELEYEGKNQSSSLSESLELLDNPSNRNIALRRALIRGGDKAITSSGIDQLYSAIKLTGLVNSKIAVTGRFVKPNMNYFEATAIGSGQVARDEKSIKMTTFEQCFWNAAHSYSGAEHLIFAYCFGRCTIDLDPSFEIEKKTGKIIYKHSDVFTLPREYQLPCQLMRITEHDSPILSILPPYLQDSSAWLNVIKSLKGKLLELPVINRDDGPLLKINRLELDHNKWSVEEGETRIAGPREIGDQVLDGVGLVVNGATKIELISDRVMNLDQCRAICLIDMRCKSFSLCTNHFSSKIECLVSDLNFRNINIQSLIMRAAMGFSLDVKNQTKIISISVDKDDISQEKNQVKVELRLDKRCRTYNKNALDLFRYPLPVKRDIPSASKITMMVNNEEECAERCLDFNIKYFDLSTKVAIEAREDSHATSGAEKVSDYCSAFDYIDLEKLNVPKPIRSELWSNSDSQDKAGICLLAKFDRVLEPVDEGLKVSMEEHEISYSFLYERQHDYKLAKVEEVDLVQGERELGHTIAVVNDQDIKFNFDVEACARTCFWQTTRVRPMCRSFDFVQEVSASRSYCILNSLSLADAQRSPHKSKLLVKIDDKSKYSHYEPLFAPGAFVAKTRLSQDQDDSTGFRLTKVGLLIIACLSLFSGAMIVIKFFHPLKGKRQIGLSGVFNLCSLLGSGAISDTNSTTHRRYDVPDLLNDARHEVPLQ